MAVAVKKDVKSSKDVAVSTRVAVLMGGDSSEREVSFESGRAVLEALKGAGVDAFAFDPSGSGLGRMLRFDPTTAFLALHGRGGEDGTLQRRLDALGMRYTGSGPEASAVAMDKELTKKAFCRRGVPTPPYRVIRREDQDRAEDLVAGLEYPLVVKPACEGSSIGVSIAASRFELLEGLDKAFRFGKRALVEKRIEGREFCVGVLGRRTLPPVEVAYAGSYFSYKAKYDDPRTAYIFDHGLSHETLREVERTSLAAFDALGCRHYGRVDLILTYGELTPYVLEVNTLPGLTGHSLLPMAARRAGISFTDLCLQVLGLAGEEDVWW